MNEPQVSKSRSRRNLSESDLLQQVIKLLEAQQPDEALRLLDRVHFDGAELRNVQGVGLMRVQRFDEAVQVYRRFLLEPGCTWLRSDTPTFHRCNYGWALGLAGLSYGAIGILKEIKNKQHPSVVRLDQAIQEWAKQLPWWQRINWRLGIEPNSGLRWHPEVGDLLDSSDASREPRVNR